MVDNETIKKLSDIDELQWNVEKLFYYDESIRISPEIKKEVLFYAKKILDRNKIKFWLADGVLLGCYRGRKFLRWDNEIDIDCKEKNIIKKMDVLKSKFIENGFIVRMTNLSRNIKMNLFKNGIKISIRGLYQDKTYRKNKYFLSGMYKYPKKFYKPLDKIKFYGKNFRCPNPVLEYIIYVYGKNWMIPIKKKDKLLGGWGKSGLRISQKDRKKLNRK